MRGEQEVNRHAVNAETRDLLEQLYPNVEWVLMKTDRGLRVLGSCPSDTKLSVNLLVKGSSNNYKLSLFDALCNLTSDNQQRSGVNGLLTLRTISKAKDFSGKTDYTFDERKQQITISDADNNCLRQKVKNTYVPKAIEILDEITKPYVNSNDITAYKSSGKVLWVKASGGSVGRCSSNYEKPTASCGVPTLLVGCDKKSKFLDVILELGGRYKNASGYTDESGVRLEEGSYVCQLYTPESLKKACEVGVVKSMEKTMATLNLVCKNGFVNAAFSVIPQELIAKMFYEASGGIVPLTSGQLRNAYKAIDDGTKNVEIQGNYAGRCVPKLSALKAISILAERENSSSACGVRK